ncbi:MAG TPA: hypothetical protein VK806_10085 [Bacteroidia bacterium]|nr:hypothetical protein [Bacteroidia bacterium]
MKNISILFIALLIISRLGFAQTTPRTILYSGIYKTAQDFKDGKLSFPMNCDSASGRMKLHHFVSGKYVSITKNKINYKLSKDSIFGYRNCKGQDYRFFENHSYEYQIAEAKSIVIYLALLADPTYTGKGIKLAPTYFFSKTLNSDIMPLTMSNLKLAFAGNTKFCNMLDGEIKSDKDLSVYDETYKMYRINYLLSQSI